METVRATVVLLLLLRSGATDADHKVEPVPQQKNTTNKSSVVVVSNVVLSNSTKNIIHEANRSASTTLAQKPKIGNISSPGRATNSTPVVAAQERLLQLEKALNVTDTEVKAKKKELKVQSSLVKEKKDAVTQEQKQVSEMRIHAEKLQKEAEVAAEIAKEKSEAAAKLWKKERAVASHAEDLQAEENETHKFLEQTQKEEATLEHARAGLHDQLSRTEASLFSMKKAFLAVAPHTQQPVASTPANATHSSKPKRTVTASTPENRKESLGEAMKRVQAENERLKHEKEELTKKLLLSQEKEALHLKLKQKLLKKEQRTLAVKRPVKKH